MVWEGSHHQVYNNAYIHNQAGANFTIQGARFFRRDLTPYFQNDGTIDGAPFNQVHEGVVRPGQRFELEMRQAGVITAAGYGQMNFLLGGTFADPGAHSRIPAMRLLYGTFNFAGSWSVDHLELGYQATLQSGNSWDVNTLLWDSAYIYGAVGDSIVVNTRLDVVATGGHPHRLDRRTLTTHGVVVVRSVSDIRMYNNAEWTSHGPVTWHMGRLWRGSAGCSFTSKGNMTIDMWDSQSLYMDAVYTLEGFLDITRGALELRQGGSMHGNWSHVSDRVTFFAGTVSLLEGERYTLDNLWIWAATLTAAGGGCDVHVQNLYWWGGTISNMRVTVYNTTNIDIKRRSYLTSASLSIQSSNATWYGTEFVVLNTATVTTSASTHLHIRAGGAFVNDLARFSGSRALVGLHFYGPVDIDIASMTAVLVRVPTHFYSSVIATRGALRLYEGGTLWLQDNIIDTNGIRIMRGTFELNATHSALPAALSVTSPLFIGYGATVDLIGGSLVVPRLVWEGGRIRATTGTGGKYSITVLQDFIAEGSSLYLQEVGLYINGTAHHKSANMYVQQNCFIHIAPQAVWNSTATNVGIYRDGTSPTLHVEGRLYIHYPRSYVLNWRLTSVFYPSCVVETSGGATLRLDYHSTLAGSLPASVTLMNGNHQFSQSYNFTYLHLSYSNTYINGHTIRAQYLDYEGGNVRGGGAVSAISSGRWQLTRAARFYDATALVVESGATLRHTGYNYWYGYNGFVFTIQSGATYHTDATGNLRHSGGGTRTKVDNYGTILYGHPQAAYDMFYFDYEQFSGAVLQTEHMATVRFRYGATFHAGAVTSGANVEMYGGTLATTGASAWQHLILRSGAVVTGSGPLTTQHLDLRQGTFPAAMTVNVTQSFVWDQGTFSGPAGDIISLGSTVLMSNRGKTLGSGRTLSLYGWTRVVACHALVMQDGAQVVNHGNMVIEPSSLLEFEYGAGLTTQTVSNYGSLTWEGTPTARQNMHVHFNSTGSVVVANSTRVRLRGNSHITGKVTVHEDATLVLSLRTHTLQGGVDGPGSIDIDSATVHVACHAATIGGLRIAGDVTLAHCTSSPQQLLQTTDLLWESGTITGDTGAGPHSDVRLAVTGHGAWDGSGVKTLDNTDMRLQDQCVTTMASASDVLFRDGASLTILPQATVRYLTKQVITSSGVGNAVVNNGSIVSVQGQVAEVYPTYSKGVSGSDSGLLGFVFFHTPGVTSALPQDSAVNVWTGASGDWNDTARWSAGHVPTFTERCSINVGGTVTIRIPVGTNATCLSLWMGTAGTYTLQVDGELFVDATSVPAQASGVLDIGSTTTVTGAGRVQVNGVLNWHGGSFTSPQLQVSVRDGIYMHGSSGKTVAVPSFTLHGHSEFFSTGDLTLAEGALFEIQINATVACVTSASIISGSGAAPIMRQYGVLTQRYPGDGAMGLATNLRLLPPQAAIRSDRGRVTITGSDVQLDGAFLMGMNNVILTPPAATSMYIFGNHSLSHLVVDTTGSINVTANIKTCQFYWRNGALEGPGMFAFTERSAVIDSSQTHHLRARSIDIIGRMYVGADLQLWDAPVMRVHLDGDLRLGPQAHVTAMGTGVPLLQVGGRLHASVYPTEFLTLQAELEMYSSASISVQHGELRLTSAARLSGSGSSDGKPRSFIGLRGSAPVTHTIDTLVAPTLSIYNSRETSVRGGKTQLLTMMQNERLAYWEGASLESKNYFWVSRHMQSNVRTTVTVTEYFTAPWTYNYHIIGIDLYTQGVSRFGGYVIRLQGASIVNQGSASMYFPFWLTSLYRYSLELDRYENKGTVTWDTLRMHGRNIESHMINHPGATLKTTPFAGFMYLYSGGNLNGTLDVCQSKEFGSAMVLLSGPFSLGDPNLRCLSLRPGAIHHLASSHLDSLVAETSHFAYPTTLTVGDMWLMGCYIQGVHLTVTKSLVTYRTATSRFLAGSLTLRSGARGVLNEGTVYMDANVFTIEQGAKLTFAYESGSRDYSLHRSFYGWEGRMRVDGELEFAGRPRAGHRIHIEVETGAQSTLRMTTGHPLFWGMRRLSFGAPVAFDTVGLINVQSAVLTSNFTANSFIHYGTTNNWGTELVGEAGVHSFKYSYFTQGLINGNWTVPTGGTMVIAARGWTGLRNGHVINKGRVDFFGGGSTYSTVSRGVNEQTFTFENTASGYVYMQKANSWHVQGNARNVIRNHGRWDVLALPGYWIPIYPHLENKGSGCLNMLAPDSRWLIFNDFNVDAATGVLNSVVLDGEGYVGGSVTGGHMIIRTGTVTRDPGSTLTLDRLVIGWAYLRFGDYVVRQQFIGPYSSHIQTYSVAITNQGTFQYTGPGRLLLRLDSTLTNAPGATMNIDYGYLFYDGYQGRGKFSNAGTLNVRPVFWYRTYDRTRVYGRGHFTNEVSGQINTDPNVTFYIERGDVDIQCQSKLQGHIFVGGRDQDRVLVSCPHLAQFTTHSRVQLGSNSTGVTAGTIKIDRLVAYATASLFGSGPSSPHSQNFTLQLLSTELHGGTVSFSQLRVVNTGTFSWLRGNVLLAHTNFTNQGVVTMDSQLTNGPTMWYQQWHCDYCRMWNQAGARIDMVGQVQMRTVFPYASYSDSMINEGTIAHVAKGEQARYSNYDNAPQVLSTWYWSGWIHRSTAKWSIQSPVQVQFSNYQTSNGRTIVLEGTDYNFDRLTLSAPYYLKGANAITVPFRFISQNTDGVRVYLDDTLILNWWGTRVEPYWFSSGVQNLLLGNRYKVRIEHRGPSGTRPRSIHLMWSSSCTRQAHTIPASVFSIDSGGVTPGLNGTYYDGGVDHQEPGFSQTDDNVNFQWAGDPPPLSGSWSIRWEGYIKAECLNSNVFEADTTPSWSGLTTGAWTDSNSWATKIHPWIDDTATFTGNYSVSTSRYHYLRAVHMDSPVAGAPADITIASGHSLSLMDSGSYIGNGATLTVVGSLLGDGDLTVKSGGRLVFESGTISLVGGIKVEAGGVIEGCTTTSCSFRETPINNYGLFNVSGTAGIYVQAGSPIYNHASGVIHLENTGGVDVDLVRTGRDAVPQLFNSGNVNVVAPGSTQTFGILLSYVGQSGGNLTVSGAGAVRIGGDAFFYPGTGVSGRLLLSGNRGFNDHTLQGDIYWPDASIELDTAQVYISPQSTWTVKSFTVVGTYTTNYIRSGAFACKLVIPADGTFTVPAGASLYFLHVNVVNYGNIVSAGRLGIREHSHLHNYGNVTITAAGLTHQYYGHVTNEASGRWVLQAAFVFGSTNCDTWLGGWMINKGTIVVDLPSTSSYVTNYCYFENDGVIDVSGTGRFRFSRHESLWHSGVMGSRDLEVAGGDLWLRDPSTARPAYLAGNADLFLAPGTLSLSASAEWRGGRVYGGHPDICSFENNGTLSFAAGNNYLMSCRLDNHGTWQFSGGNIYSRGSPINNQAGATFHWSSTGGIYRSTFYDQLTNLGTWNWDTSAGSTRQLHMRLNLYHNITMYPNSGTLQLSAGARFSQAIGSGVLGQILFATGEFDIADSHISNLRVQGTAYMRHALPQVTVDSLSWNGGHFSAGLWNINSATITGVAGHQYVRAGADVHITSSASLTGTRYLYIYGGRFTVDAGATFTVADPKYISWADWRVPIIIKGRLVSTFAPGPDASSPTTMQSSTASAWHFARGSSFDFARTTSMIFKVAYDMVIEEPSFDFGPRAELNGRYVYLMSGNETMLNNVAIKKGNIWSPGVTRLTQHNFYAGRFETAPYIVYNCAAGDCNWVSDASISGNKDIDDYGAVINLGYLQITGDGTGNVRTNRFLNEKGALFQVQQGKVCGSPTSGCMTWSCEASSWCAITNRGNMTVDLPSGRAFTFGQNIYNDGTFHLAGGSANKLGYTRPYRSVGGGVTHLHTGDGTMPIMTGSQEFQLYGGQLTGSGTVAATVRNYYGSISPSHSIASPGTSQYGALTLSNYRQEPYGSMVVDIGPSNTTELDTVHVTGSVTSYQGRVLTRLNNGASTSSTSFYRALTTASATTFPGAGSHTLNMVDPYSPGECLVPTYDERNSIVLRCPSPGSKLDVQAPDSVVVREDEVTFLGTFNIVHEPAMTLEDEASLGLFVEVENGVVNLATIPGQGEFIQGGPVVPRSACAETTAYVGALQAVTSALRNATYVSNPNYNGAELITLLTTNLGYRGSGGLVSQRKIAVTVLAVNDAPELNSTQYLELNEDTSVVYSGFELRDLDLAETPGSNMTMTMSCMNGTLSLQTIPPGSLLFQQGSGVNDHTMRFTFTDITTVQDVILRNVTYRPDPNFNGNDTCTYLLDDQGNTGLGGALNVTNTTIMHVISVNDAPVLTAPDTVSTNEDTGVRVPIVPSDLDLRLDVEFNLTFSVNLTVYHGSLLFPSSPVSVQSTAPMSYTISGMFNELVAALRDTDYVPALNFNGKDFINITLNDLGNIGLGGPLSAHHVINVTVNAVNDAPTTNFTTGPIVVTENCLLTLDAASVQDVDLAASERLNVSIHATHGTLTLGGSGTTGLLFQAGSGANDALVQFRGTQAQAAAALTGLQYQPKLNYAPSGSNDDTIELSIDDLGQHGIGGLKSVTRALVIDLIADVGARLNVTLVPGSGQGDAGDVIPVTLTVRHLASTRGKAMGLAMQVDTSQFARVDGGVSSAGVTGVSAAATTPRLVDVTVPELGTSETLTVSFNIKLSQSVGFDQLTVPLVANLNHTRITCSGNQTVTVTAPASISVLATPSVTMDSTVTTSDSVSGSAEYIGANRDLVEGEQIVVRHKIQLREGRSQITATFNITHPLALQYRSARVVSMSAPTLSSSSLSQGSAPTQVQDSTGDGQSNLITFAFGVVNNTADNVVNTADEIVIEMVAQVPDALPSGYSFGQVVSISSRVDYTLSSSTSVLDLDLVGPTLTLAASTNTSVVDAEQARSNLASNPVHGSPILFTLVVSSSASSSAVSRQVNITDTLSPSYVLHAGTVTSSAGTVVTGNTAGATSVLVTVPDVAKSQVVTVTYVAHLAPSIAVGSNVTALPQATYSTTIPSESSTYGRVTVLQDAQYVYLNIPGPKITALVADDPDDADRVHSDDDTVVLQFAEATNQPAGASKAQIDAWLSFSTTIGTNYVGQWISPTQFKINITTAGGTAPVIGTDSVTLTSQLRNAALTSVFTDWTSPVFSGDWGRLGPEISAFAADDPDDGDAVFSVGDTMRVTFDTDVNTPAVSTYAQLSNEVEFLQGNPGTGLTGAWNGTRVLIITVNALTGVTVLPEIGRLAIRVKPGGTLRDINSITIPQYSPSPNITGDWGLLPGPSITAASAEDPDDSEMAFAANDRIMLTFSEATNQPSVGSVASVDALLSFSQPIGSSYSGNWVTPSSLHITIVDPGTSNPDLGTLYVTVLASGALRNAADNSLPSTANATFTPTSTWGLEQPPRLVSVVADDPDDLDSTYGPGDLLTVTFDKPGNKPDISTMSKLQTFVTFTYQASPVLWGINITGSWNAAGDVATMSINDVTGQSNVPASIADIAKMTVSLKAGDLQVPSGKGSTRSIFDSSVSASGSWGSLPPPKITSAIAADPGHRDTVYSAGDTITIIFDVATNQPTLGGKTAVDSVFTFSQPLGSNYSAVWVSPTVAVVTVLEADPLTPPVPGTLQVSVLASANLMTPAENTLPSTSTQTVTGNWGLPPGPVIISAIASGASNADAVVSNKDVIRVTFDQATNQPDVSSKAGIDAVFQFSHTLGLDYSGEWVSPSDLVITVVNSTGSTVPPFFDSVSGELLASSGFQITITTGIQNSNGTSQITSGVNKGVGGNWGTARLSVSSAELIFTRPLPASSSGAQSTAPLPTIRIKFSEACDRVISLTNPHSALRLTSTSSVPTSANNGASAMKLTQTVVNVVNLTQAGATWSNTDELTISNVPVDTPAYQTFTLAILGPIRDTAQIKRPIGSSPVPLTIVRPEGPLINTITVADPDNQDDKLSYNDTVTVAFDLDTNTPTFVGSKQGLDTLFVFSYPLGQNYSGAWISPTTLLITVLNAVPLVNSSLPRTPANLALTVQAAAELRDSKLITQPSVASKLGATGTWGSGLGSAITTSRPVNPRDLAPPCETFWCRFWWLLGIAFSLCVLGILFLAHGYSVRQLDMKKKSIEERVLKARVVMVDKDTGLKDSVRKPRPPAVDIPMYDSARAIESLRSPELQLEASLAKLPPTIPNLSPVLARNGSMADMRRELRKTSSAHNVRTSRPPSRGPSRLSHQSTASSLRAKSPTLQSSGTAQDLSAPGTLGRMSRSTTESSIHTPRHDPMPLTYETIPEGDELEDELGPAVAAPPPRQRTVVPTVNQKRRIPMHAAKTKLQAAAALRNNPFGRTSSQIEDLPALDDPNRRRHTARAPPAVVPHLHQKRRLPSSAMFGRSETSGMLRTASTVSGQQAGPPSRARRVISQGDVQSPPPGVPRRATLEEGHRRDRAISDGSPVLGRAQLSSAVLSPAAREPSDAAHLGAVTEAPPRLPAPPRRVIPKAVTAALAAAGAFAEGSITAQLPKRPSRHGKQPAAPSSKSAGLGLFGSHQSSSPFALGTRPTGPAPTRGAPPPGPSTDASATENNDPTKMV
eukprot:TRINITY_DN2040_c0_g1_i1.p1 TRINITY_DN2040_c0_g1~~TRINITY_DN2040_c0_g1_i1.p1  ORF type:complete len:6542 (+),score=1422.00 TRINITY_DN2040_c0_g1_i1:1620-21245(+)